MVNLFLHSSSNICFLQSPPICLFCQIPCKSISRLEWFLGEEIRLPGDNGAETFLPAKCLILGGVGGEVDDAGNVKKLYQSIVGGGKSYKWQWS